MNDITFSTHQLIIDSQGATIDCLSDAYLDQKDTFSDTDNFYQITKENYNDKYMWLYAEYGKAFPRTDIVINTSTFQAEQNPRSLNQLEPDKQFFSLYNCASQTLFISNRQKIGFYQAYLKSILSKDVFVKNFYIDPDRFAQKIKSIDCISMVTSNNLFTARSGLFDEETNVFGLGQPATFELTAKFDDNTPVTDKFVEKLKGFISKKYQGEINTLVCIGKDDNNIESIFNVDSFIERITLSCKKDRQGLFLPDEIKSALLRELKII